MSRASHAIDLSSLAPRLSGAALAPGDDGWDAARQAWNLAADQHPAAWCSPSGADDVRATVDFAREHGLRVAPQSTGHAASGIASLDGTILLRTLRMAGVEIDAGARRARVEAGALWGDVGAKAAEHGLVGRARLGGRGGRGRLHARRRHSAGSAASTGWRRTACSRSRWSPADGELVRADHDSEPDLFWALRGGGGSFGVVTAHGVLALPAGRGVRRDDRLARRPRRRGDPGLSRVDRATCPDEMTAWVRFLTLPAAARRCPSRCVATRSWT